MNRRGVWPRQCIQCGRLMRPRLAKKADYPETLMVGAKGKCDTCYTRDRRSLKRGTLVLDTGEAREVLTRVYLTPSTYKTLRRAKVDVGAVLSKAADQIAAEVNRRA